MAEVRFYSEVRDELLRFAVIVSSYQGKWVFCKHKKRDTYECPGGHREAGESILNTAKRELWEETGAVKYELKPVCVYSVTDEHGESYGMLYAADIYELDKLPCSEIERIELFNEPPSAWTYPHIQPLLLDKVKAIAVKCI